MTVEILDKLQEDKTEFGPYQEEAIISLALDFPDFFTSVSRYIRPEMFSKNSAQYVLAFILNSINEHNVIPTRELLYDQIARSLKVDDNFEDVLNIVNRKSDPREIPILKNQLLQWTKNKAYGLLFNDESLMAYQRGDFGYLDDILSSANRIADVGDKGLWFFEQISSVFAEGANKHMTTGFHKLDAILNDGGPSPGEVVCYLAPTNVGKCCSLNTKIIEEKLSRLYELEFEDGSVRLFRGSREVQTARGTIKICDLTESDCITEMPVGDDGWDMEL